MSKKDNPVSIYAMVSQVAFLVIVPLLFFIWGGSWLIRQFSLPQWLMVVFVIVGILTMICSVATYLKKLMKMYDDSKPDENSHLKHDKKDNDY